MNFQPIPDPVLTVKCKCGADVNITQHCASCARCGWTHFKKYPVGGELNQSFTKGQRTTADIQEGRAVPQFK